MLLFIDKMTKDNVSNFIIKLFKLQKVFVCLFSFSLILAIACCDLKQITGYTNLTVTAVGNIDKTKHYIILPFNFQKNNLEYAAINNKVSKQLTSLGYNLTDDIKQADYAIFFIYKNQLTNLNYKQTYNNVIPNRNNYSYTSDSLIINTKLDFKLDIFAIENTKIAKQVYSANILHNQNNNQETNKYTTISDIICSVDAIFKLPKASEFEEYNYKCLRAEPL
ncbi:hypothetical protein ACFX5K_03030 [Rickettsiales bacterium LUAb2]